MGLNRHPYFQINIAIEQLEEDELFKLVDKYFDEIPSLFELFEQEHELAEQFMDVFISVVDQNICIQNLVDAKNMAIKRR
jgi:hypothetical protein